MYTEVTSRTAVADASNMEMDGGVGATLQRDRLTLSIRRRCRSMFGTRKRICRISVSGVTFYDQQS